VARRKAHTYNSVLPALASRSRKHVQRPRTQSRAGPRLAHLFLFHFCTGRAFACRAQTAKTMCKNGGFPPDSEQKAPDFCHLAHGPVAGFLRLPRLELRDRAAPGPFARPGANSSLEKIPERLVVNRVMELHLGTLDERAQLLRATVGSGLLEVDVTALHIGAENLRDPFR